MFVRSGRHFSSVVRKPTRPEPPRKAMARPTSVLPAKASDIARRVEARQVDEVGAADDTGSGEADERGDGRPRRAAVEVQDDDGVDRDGGAEQAEAGDFEPRREADEADDDEDAAEAVHHVPGEVPRRVL